MSCGLNALSGIMEKLNGPLEPEEGPTTAKAAAVVKEEKEEAKAAAVAADEVAEKFPELGPDIATEKADEYSDKVSWSCHNNFRVPYFQLLK